MMKGDGGAIGLFHDRDALTQLLIVMPELARMMSEFESTLPETESEEEDMVFLHNEMGKTFQKSFQADVVKLYEKIIAIGNPFLANHPSLLKLMSQDIVDVDVSMFFIFKKNLETQIWAKFKHTINKTSKRAITRERRRFTANQSL